MARTTAGNNRNQKSFATLPSTNIPRSVFNRSYNIKTAFETMKVALIVEPFVPGENLHYADLTLASFTGSDPLTASSGGFQVALRPPNDEQFVTIRPPVGNWRWECSAPPAIPQTVYGFAIYNDTLDPKVLLGVQALAVPEVITNASDFIDIDIIAFGIALQPFDDRQ